MSDETQNPQDPNEDKSRWQSILDAMSSPIDFLHNWTSKSPLLTVLAVVFLVQPVISTGIDLINELRHVKHATNPLNRPVTEQELDIVNQKINFLQQLIIADLTGKRSAQQTRASDVISTATKPQSWQQLQKKLDTVQKQLDNTYTQQQQSQK